MPKLTLAKDIYSSRSNLLLSQRFGRSLTLPLRESRSVIQREQDTSHDRSHSVSGSAPALGAERMPDDTDHFGAAGIIGLEKVDGAAVASGDADDGISRLVSILLGMPSWCRLNLCWESLVGDQHMKAEPRHAIRCCTFFPNTGLVFSRFRFGTATFFLIATIHVTLDAFPVLAAGSRVLPAGFDAIATTRFFPGTQKI